MNEELNVLCLYKVDFMAFQINQFLLSPLTSLPHLILSSFAWGTKRVSKSQFSSINEILSINRTPPINAATNALASDAFLSARGCNVFPSAISK